MLGTVVCAASSLACVGGLYVSRPHLLISLILCLKVVQSYSLDPILYTVFGDAVYSRLSSKSQRQDTLHSRTTEGSCTSDCTRTWGLEVANQSHSSRNLSKEAIYHEFMLDSPQPLSLMHRQQRY